MSIWQTSTTQLTSLMRSITVEPVQLGYLNRQPADMGHLVLECFCIQLQRDAPSVHNEVLEFVA